MTRLLHYLSSRTNTCIGGREDYIESTRQPEEPGASDEESGSENSEPVKEAKTPRYTSGTIRAWGSDALKKFNELCASISSQRLVVFY